jgi:peroxiredoxin-like protein
MLPLPHRYIATAVPTGSGEVRLATPGAPNLVTASPPEFDGPGGRWSPEALLVGAAADCFAITFVGVARASGVAWTSMTCEAVGTLDRQDGTTRFTRIDLDVRVGVPEGRDVDRVQRVIDKAKRSCLITNSLNAAVHLRATVHPVAVDADTCPA